MSETYKSVIGNRKPEHYNYKPKSYPLSDEYDYFSRLKLINLDDRREYDLENNRAFKIGKVLGLKKDLKSDESIFSSKFGSTIKDLNPYMTKYKCNCTDGNGLMGTVNEGVYCPRCKSVVKYVDDDFEYGAYCVLNDYYIIHPNLYAQLDNFIGKENKQSILENILRYNEGKDQDGHATGEFKKPKSQPYYGLGMIDFKEKFDEIMQYYLNVAKSKSKQAKIEAYYYIMESRDSIFTKSIYVFSALMRPVDTNANVLAHESTNQYYYMISKLVDVINDNGAGVRKRKDNKNDLLFDLQMKQKGLYSEVVTILSSKRGAFRSAFGGRCNMSGRNVIKQGVDLEIDEVTLSYYSLVELLQLRIINILKKCYNITYSEAYDIWYMANLKIDNNIVDIINALIKGSCNGRGLPIFINRNPTIVFGGVLQMFVVGMNMDHTMSVPLRTLRLYAGDFDGDVENIFLIINNELLELAIKILNPRNSMIISRNDGWFNQDTDNQTDTYINANTLMRICKDMYTQEELAEINAIKDRIV